MFQPFGNTTVLPPAKWHPEPCTRGTFSILSSCLITMSLCVWTSLHLNVPEHKKEHLQKYRQIVWMVLGLLAPELVVWNAWEQRKRMKEISVAMQEKGFMPKSSTLWERVRRTFSGAKPNSEKLGPHRRYNGHIHAWTDVHSWLVVMGGLGFEDTSPEHQQFMPEGRNRIPLHVRIFTWILQFKPHLIPDISREHIEDKSKSDQLAKALTCWQASYFCIQSIFRLSQRLSITLLEVNVFAHAVCALMLFFIWWDKPRNIYEPILISSKEMLDICAYHLSSVEDISYHRDDLMSEIFQSERAISRSVPNALVFCAISDPEGVWNCLHLHHKSTFYVVRPDDDREPLRCSSTIDGEYYDFIRIRDTYWKIKWDNISNVSASRRAKIVVTLDGRSIELWVRVYRCLQSNLEIDTGLRLETAAYAARLTNWKLRYWDTLHLLALGPPKDVFQPILGWLIAGLTLAGASYGGIHLIAWANVFPSRVETMLWRAASVTILSTGPSFALAALCGSSLVWLTDGNEVLEVLSAFCFLMLELTFLLWYTLCRAFIVVECFILLAHIPESALHMPTWSTYIPHIS